MCDYSLYTVNNRLACESDDLVLHRFDTGSLGFCAVAELEKEMAAERSLAVGRVSCAGCIPASNAA